jgi:hypothetical protein
MNEVQQIKQATNTFLLQFEAVPGDMANAYSFWGSSCANNAANCNGDNSGNVWDSKIDEEWMFWKHLALAEVYPGNFTGQAEDGSYGSGDCDLNVNVPESTLSGSAYRVESYSGSGTVISDVGSPKVMIQYGTNITGYPSYQCADGPVLIPNEAKALDQKVDDDSASTGKMVARDSTGGANCIDGSNVLELDQTTAQCRIFFHSGI